MSFLKKMFGKKDPFLELQQLYADREWANLRLAAKRLDRETLDAEATASVDAWLREAGDRLARVNLEEADYAYETGSRLKAREHYQLACEQAVSTELRERADAALAALDQGTAVPQTVAEDTETAAAETVDDGSCGTSCGPACGTHAAPESDAGADDHGQIEEEAYYELLLASIPPELAERIDASCEEFRRGWMALQANEVAKARRLFDEVPPDQRGALFKTEYGVVLARLGESDRAIDLLGQAVREEPGLFHAFEALVVAMAGARRGDALLTLLKQTLSEDRFVPFCWSWTARIHARRGQEEPALAAGLKALEEGAQDPALSELCARLLERQERVDEAEAVLQRLPAGGGCGGGGHPLLAEFWLRHGRNLNVALETFKGALRQEQGNPRWVLRIAQVYLAKGWRKEASALIEQLLASGDLPAAIQAEVKATAAKLIA